MYFTSGSDRAFEQLMQGKPGFDHYDSGEAVTPEDCGTCRFYRPHWKYQFCVYAECPYQPGKLTAYDAVTFRVKGVENMAVFRVERNKGYRRKTSPLLFRTSCQSQSVQPRPILRLLTDNASQISPFCLSCFSSVRVCFPPFCALPCFFLSISPAKKSKGYIYPYDIISRNGAVFNAISVGVYRIDGV